MTWNEAFPPDVIAWLLRYGVFSALSAFALLGLGLLLRPYWLWFSGRAEQLERLKRLEETQRRALLELEVLNQTLALPVKRAAQKAAADKKGEEPLVVSQEAKDAFLKVLEERRAKPDGV